MSRILRYSCVLLLVSLLSSSLCAATPTDSDTTKTNVKRYASREEAAAANRKAENPLFAGCSLSGDLAGLVMMSLSSYGQAEAALRINMKNRYFPIFEAGWGVCDHDEYTTGLHYKTNAPFFRIGCDYNLSKNLRSGNRVFVGLRYGFTSFKYDLDGPAIVDPVWGTETPFSFHSVRSGMGWGEAVFGLEAKLWKFFHLGWTFRYRLRFHEKTASPGSAWYVPGYGKNDSHALGGTFNITFDI